MCLFFSCSRLIRKGNTENVLKGALLPIPASLAAGFQAVRIRTQTRSLRLAIVCFERRR